MATQPAPFPSGTTVEQQVSACTLAWIKYLVCGNPILKSLILSTIAGLQATLQAETSLLIIEAGRLNILAELAQIEIAAIQGITNKTQSELNLLLGPLASSNCVDLQALSAKLQSSATGKILVAAQNYIYKYNRYSQLEQAKLSQIAQNNQLTQWLTNFQNAINTVCSS
jgi:hypothetical protein